MKVTLDMQTIQSINLFQNMTGSTIVDCISNGEIYFVVAEGQYGLTVGKGGIRIKNAERVFKKNIIIFEYSKDLTQFVKNLVPEAEEIEVRGKSVVIKVKNSDRAKVIGKNGKHIKTVTLFLGRLFGVSNLKIK